MAKQYKFPELNIPRGGLTIDHLINFYKLIPRSMWTTNIQIDSAGRRCAYGMFHDSDATMWDFDWNKYEERTQPVRELMVRNGFRDNVLVIVNNNGHLDYFTSPRLYQQKTPKGRVLAFLKDVKAGKFKN